MWITDQDGDLINLNQMIYIGVKDEVENGEEVFYVRGVSGYLPSGTSICIHLAGPYATHKAAQAELQRLGANLLEANCPVNL